MWAWWCKKGYIKCRLFERIFTMVLNVMIYNFFIVIFLKQENMLFGNNNSSEVDNNLAYVIIAVIVFLYSSFFADVLILINMGIYSSQVMKCKEIYFE